MKKPEIIVALDVASTDELSRTLKRLPADWPWFKVGLELFSAEGPQALIPLQTKGKSIFLDLKLHDIPRTVEKSVQAIARHRIDLLTLHASGGSAMLKAAAHAAQASDTSLRLLAVTVLTSLDRDDLTRIGIARAPADQALALAEMAYACGIHGVVCSVHEAARIRQALGPDALIVTPGIRLPGDATGDQKRVATPREAQRAGATHLVIGRPILEAPDPAIACEAIRQDLAGDG